MKYQSRIIRIEFEAMNEQGEKVRVGISMNTVTSAAIALEKMGVSISENNLYHWLKERIMPCGPQFDNLTWAGKKIIEAYGNIVQWHVCVKRCFKK